LELMSDLLQYIVGNKVIIGLLSLEKLLR